MYVCVLFRATKVVRVDTEKKRNKKKVLSFFFLVVCVCLCLCEQKKNEPVKAEG